MPERFERIDQAQALLYHARSATLFCSEDGEACASIPTGIDSRRVLALRSASFRDWLIANFYSEYETAPSASAFRAALHVLEARARFGDFPAQKVDLRLSFEGDPYTPARIFLDLSNAEGEVVEISAAGWQIANNLRRPFRQSATSLASPRPEHPESAGKTLEIFARLFRLTEANRTRALTWLITALRPVAPYPILVLRGPAASGKSTLARALRALIDPAITPIRRLPARDRELFQFASSNWVLVFDHVQRVPGKIAEALCAVSSGESVERARVSRAPILFHTARPVILISPDDQAQPAWTPPHTLSNRTLVINLPPLATLRAEAELWPEFESSRAVVLGALTDALSTALRRARETQLSGVVRLPDCATWAAAAAPALGLDAAAIAEIFTDSSSIWTGSDPLREAVHALLAGGNPWSGSASELLTQVRGIFPRAVLPATPKGLSQALAKVTGVVLTRKRDSQGERILTLTRTKDAFENTPAAAGTILSNL